MQCGTIPLFNLSMGQLDILFFISIVDMKKNS